MAHNQKKKKKKKKKRLVIDSTWTFAPRAKGRNRLVVQTQHIRIANVGAYHLLVES